LIYLNITDPLTLKVSYRYMLDSPTSVTQTYQSLFVGRIAMHLHVVQLHFIPMSCHSSPQSFNITNKSIKDADNKSKSSQIEH